MSASVEGLTQAFRLARKAAEEAQGTEDGGTANLDSAFLYARLGLTEATVQRAATAAGISVRRHNTRFWRGWFIEVARGQGAMRTRMARAAHEALQAAGQESSVYYQID
jgi:hypothetical protein